MEPYRHLTERARAELHARASVHQDDPEKTRRAVELVEQGRVERTGPDSWEVIGSQGTIYTLVAGKCSCKARSTPGTPWACYHRLAVAFSGWVEKALQEEGHPMFVEEAEEHLGQTPHTTHDVALQSTNGIQDDAQDVPQPAPVQEPVSALHEDREAGHDLVKARGTDTEHLRLQRYVHYLEQEIEKREGWVERVQERVGALEERLRAQQQPLPDLTLPPRSISAIIADLSRPLPEGCLGNKPKGGQKIRFLHWPTVVHLLDTYAPGWQGAVVRVDKVGERCAVTYRITIPALEGTFSHEDAGMEDEDHDEYGDAMTNAIAAALKRAAAKFGVGRWLYEKDEVTRALHGHLKAEKAEALAELAKLADMDDLPREQVIQWLKVQTGAQTNAGIPLWAIRALIQHLSAKTLV